MLNNSGLFIPYKLNRPLTKEEKNNRFCQGQWRKVDFIMNEDSVIRMNSTYLETVCKYYSDKGIASSMFVPLFLVLIWGIYVGLISVMKIIGYGEKGSFLIEFSVILILLFMAYFISKLIHKEWFRKTHYPIRFNRKNQMIYVYQVSGEELAVPWQKVFFTAAGIRRATTEWGIDGHILAEDGETVVNTFSLAVSIMGSKKQLAEHWEFIRCYMEEDCVADLAELVALCPPVETRKEGYIFGLQYLLKMGSRLEWLFFPLMLPLDLLASVARYIAMQSSQIPQWPSEVQAQCSVVADDPVNVSAANNPQHLWRYVLANEKREEYEALYARQTAANERIKAKLAARYGK